VLYEARVALVVELLGVLVGQSLHRFGQPTHLTGPLGRGNDRWRGGRCVGRVSPADASRDAGAH
jgi:hypothetical protein